MADGTRQQRFGFPQRAIASALRPGEIVVDFFAGGGGASEALRQALGRDPDVAVNHDHDALGMHAANHPFTWHMEADVWTVDILREVAGRPVGWFHASPDCTHFSQAKGGQPRDRATRSLSWVVVKVAGTLARHGLAPRIISLENVRQILGWCQLVAKRDKATGRVLKLDGTVAAPGERVPLREQFLVPDKRRLGKIWRQFVAALRALGYVVEWRILRACDYGAGTSRGRLFLIARRDGEPIQWPEPTHGHGRAQPHVTAADCIDWSIPCPSIFERKKPLADATCRRIARGVRRYVLAAAEPFIVSTGEQHHDRTHPQAEGKASAGKGHISLCQPGTGSIRPTGTQRPPRLSGAQGGSGAGVTSPFVTEHANASRAASWRADEPMRTQCAGVKGGHFALVTAFLEQANGGGENGNSARARGADEPVSSITGTGSKQRLVTADLAQLAPDHEAGALRVAAFLINYYGNGQALDLREPVDTVTTRDRIALVTVVIRGTPYVIVDIGLRMLKPRELYRAQGFPADYIIDRTASGKPLTISAAVRMVGNSVSPPPLAAIARANLDQVSEPERMAA